MKSAKRCRSKLLRSKSPSASITTRLTLPSCTRVKSSQVTLSSCTSTGDRYISSKPPSFSRSISASDFTIEVQEAVERDEACELGGNIGVLWGWNRTLELEND